MPLLLDPLGPLKIEAVEPDDLEEMPVLIKEEPYDCLIYNEDYFGKHEDPIDLDTDYSDNLSNGEVFEAFGATSNDNQLARKRERNRIAVWRLRQRIKIEINNLNDQAAQWMVKNEALETQKRELSREIRDVKNLLLETLGKKPEVRDVGRHHHLDKVEEEEVDVDNFVDILLSSENSKSIPSSSLKVNSIIFEPPPVVLPKSSRNRKKKNGRTNEDKKKPWIEITDDMDETTKRRELNKRAVFRFRQREREEMNIIQGEIYVLEGINLELVERKENLRKQINLVRSLLREKFRNGKKSIGSDLKPSGKLLNLDTKLGITFNFIKKKKL